MQAFRRIVAESLPGTCQVCAAWPAQPVCEDCLRRFTSQLSRCRACAVATPDDFELCGACLTRPDRATVQQCVVAVDYAYPWDTLIARFKFRSEPGWAQPFAQLLLNAGHTAPLLRTRPLVVPIPLTATRLGERGYNQAWELVKALQVLCTRSTPTLSFDALATALVRLGETHDQHSLGREARLRNLRGAFAAHPSQTHRLQGRHVLLVDDVTTTGATLHTAAQALLHAGADRVSALVFARTPPNR